MVYLTCHVYRTAGQVLICENLIVANCEFVLSAKILVHVLCNNYASSAITQ